ncbi:MAG: aminoacyl-tRNA hydrolase [Patescibacteria group bacterium]
MKLIVGLGNPEPQYSNTRHNLGAMVVKLLARSSGQSDTVEWQTFRQKAKVTQLVIDGQTVRLSLPLTYMNESDKAVGQLVKFYKIDHNDLWIVHDDLDLPFAAVRLSWQSSSAGHRGVDSIIETLGTTDFWRFRLGLGRPPALIPADKYVLQPFTPEEQGQLPMLLSKAVTRLKLALAEGPRLALHKHND